MFVDFNFPTIDVKIPDLLRSIEDVSKKYSVDNDQPRFHFCDVLAEAIIAETLRIISQPGHLMRDIGVELKPRCPDFVRYRSG